MKTFFTLDDPVVPANHPRMLVDTATAQGADRNAILVDAGVSYQALLEPHYRISYAQYLRIADSAMRLTNNPAIGLDFGRQANIGHWGVVGLAAMNGVTAGEALRLGLTYYRNFAPGWDLSIHVDEQGGHFVARETIPRGALIAFATEAMLVTLQRLCSQVVGREIPPAREVRFTYPRPPHADRYFEYMPAASMVFDCEVTEVIFDPSSLGERIAGADPTMAVIAERYCVAEADRAAPGEGLLAQVRKVLTRGLAPRPTLEDVARELRTSSRSLRRGLQEMGTSFRALIDEAARDRAEELVRRNNDKLEHVASELGFADVRTFRRAFKRWTGHSPAAFRSRAMR
jgi:AraC-like DNA-binding protein